MKRNELLKTLALWIIAILLLANFVAPSLAKGKAPNSAAQIAALQKQVSTLAAQNADYKKRIGALEGQMRYYANLQGQVNQLATLSSDVAQLKRNDTDLVKMIVNSSSPSASSVSQTEFSGLKNRVSSLDSSIGSKWDSSFKGTIWGHINDIESKLR